MMPRPPPRPPPSPPAHPLVPTRFSLERAILNIRDMVYRTGVLQKDVAYAIGVTESQFTQKMRSIRNRFTIEELGRISEFFSRHTGKPLTGWPLFDERFADLIDRVLEPYERRPLAAPSRRKGPVEDDGHKDDR